MTSIRKSIKETISTLRSLFVPPEFDNQEESTIARLQMQFIAPLMIIAPIVAAIATALAPEFLLRWSVFLAYVWLSGISSLIVIRCGKPRVSGYLLLVEYWVFITAFCVTGGGIRTPVVTGYLVLIIAAGLLVGAKAGLLTAMVSILTELGLVYLGKFVALPKPVFPRTDLLLWTVDGVHAVVLAVLQYVASSNFRGAFQSVDRELAERRRTESSLRQSEERYSRLSQATFEGIVVSERGTIVDVNDQALRMFGCKSDEMMGRSILEFLEPAAINSEAQRIASNKEEPHENLALRKDGTTFPVETRSRSLSIGGHDMRLTTIRDITERRQAEILQNAVYRISQAPDKSSSLEELYKTVHEIISTVMPANNFYIALYDDKEDIVSFPYFIDEVDAAYPPHKAGKGLTEYVIRTGRSLMCDEATDRELTLRGEIALVGTPSTIWIGVPLKVESKTFGVMAIQHYTDQNAYGERDLKMLEYVSEQVARAIDRKRTEDAWQRERILLRTLVDNLPTPIWVKNREHQKTLVNPAHLRRVRMSSGRADLNSEEDILGKTDFDIYPQKMAEEYFTEDQKVIRDGEQILDKEVYQVDPEGRPRWELLSKIPMRDRDGAIIGLVGIATDITERKLSEENLRQLNAFNEMLIQTFPFGIEIVDEQGKILFMSERMKVLIGFDAVGWQCLDLYGDNKMQCEGCPLSRLITVGESNSFEVAGVLNGRTFQINHTGIMYNGQKAILEIFQDITEKKKLQSQFLQAQKLEGLGNIAAGIAHDFNNILGVILGYAEMINDSASANGKSDPGLQAIIGSSRRGKSLVSQLLMFARKTETTFEIVQVNDIVKEIEGLLNATFPKTIQIETKLPENLPRITADPNQLHQVLLNVCVNARDAMPNGGVLSISTSVVSGETIAAKHRGATASRYVKLEVSDSGVGMDDATRARIFEPFFSTKGIGKGTGLGLSVVYGIVESHHGFVEVGSDLGKGTTFSICFPVEEQPTERLEPQKQSAGKISGGTETILVIEDEEMLRELAESILTSNGYNVVTARDGEGGVEAFRMNKERIAAVLSDLGLPRLSGHEVVGKIREIDPTASVIIASGYISPDIRDGLENLGVKAFIQKPYMMRDVLNAVRNVIDAKDRIGS